MADFDMTKFSLFLYALVYLINPIGTSRPIELGSWQKGGHFFQMVSFLRVEKKTTLNDVIGGSFDEKHSEDCGINQMLEFFDFEYPAQMYFNPDVYNSAISWDTSFEKTKRFYAACQWPFTIFFRLG